MKHKNKNQYIVVLKSKSSSILRHVKSKPRVNTNEDFRLIQEITELKKQGISLGLKHSETKKVLGQTKKVIACASGKVRVSPPTIRVSKDKKNVFMLCSNIIQD